LTWDGLGFPCYAHAEIWAADSNDLGLAVLIGTTSATIFTHNIGGSATRYYWIRYVNTRDVKGPYNAVAGTAGTTGDDPGYLLELLTGEITSGQLHNTLGTRIDLIDGADTLPGSVAARIKAETDARALAILGEHNARVLADNQLQQQQHQI
jgi:predicted phage tail protein